MAATGGCLEMRSGQASSWQFIDAKPYIYIYVYIYIYICMYVYIYIEALFISPESPKPDARACVVR